MKQDTFGLQDYFRYSSYSLKCGGLDDHYIFLLSCSPVSFPDVPFQAPQQKYYHHHLYDPHFFFRSLARPKHLSFFPYPILFYSVICWNGKIPKTLCPFIFVDHQKVRYSGEESITLLYSNAHFQGRVLFSVYIIC